MAYYKIQYSLTVIDKENRLKTVCISFFLSTAVAESSAPTTGMPITTSAGQVNEGNTGSPFPGFSGSLEDRCIYDSLGTSAAVLAVLLAIIILLLLLLLISCCILIREKRRTIAKKYL